MTYIMMSNQLIEILRALTDDVAPPCRLCFAPIQDTSRWVNQEHPAYTHDSYASGIIMNIKFTPITKMHPVHIHHAKTSSAPGLHLVDNTEHNI